MAAPILAEGREWATALGHLGTQKRELARPIGTREAQPKVPSSPRDLIQGVRLGTEKVLPWIRASAHTGADTGHLRLQPGSQGLPYDPDRAKALLREAGHPKGFSTEISGYPALKEIL
jgi:hypothetical protein